MGESVPPPEDHEPTLRIDAQAFPEPASTVDRSRVDASLESTAPIGPRLSDGSATYVPGIRIDNYVLVREIARGGMGVVFQARQLPIDRIVALKMILGGTLASGEQIRRFHAEARAAARLNHPNLVPIYDVGEFDGTPYFSMEYVDGHSLADGLRDRPYPSRRAAELMAVIADAIACAHDAGVLHRDLKPSNVLMTKDGQPKVTDFGLAKQVEEDRDLTASGSVLGTPGYMPPEQALGRRDAIGVASDIYSLGATLYALLTGRPPFESDSVGSTLLMVIREAPLPPRRRVASIDRDLETICLKCLAKEPAERYASAGELADELRRYLRGETIRARRATVVETAWRWSRRNRIATALGVAVLLAVIAVSTAVMLELRGRHERRIGTLEREIQELAERSEPSAALLADVAARRDALRQLDPAAAERTERRFAAALRSRLEKLIDRPRLENAARAELERIFVALDDRSFGIDVNGLRQRLEQSVGRWQVAARLAPPYPELSETFAPETLTTDGFRLLPTIVDGGRDVTIDSRLDSSGDVEIEAAFAADWSERRVIGLAIDRPESSSVETSSGPRSAVDASDRRGSESVVYEFLLHGPRRSPRELPDSLPPIEDRTHDGQVELQIRRQGVSLGSRIVSLAAKEPLRMTARRSGRTLSLQVQNSPPLEIDELFSVRATEGVRRIAIVDLPSSGTADPGLALTELTVRRRELAARPHPLERGDHEFAAGAYDRALTLYRELPAGATDDERSEARYKQALCLTRLDRSQEAEEVLVEAGDQSDPAWRFRSLAQLWLLYLDQGRRDEAQLLQQRLTADVEFARLVPQLPRPTIDRLIEHALSDSLERTDNIVVTPARIEELKRTVDLLDVLAASLGLRLDALWMLSSSCQSVGDWQGSLEAARSALDEELRGANRSDFLHLAIVALVRLERLAEAQELLVEMRNDPRATPREVADVRLEEALMATAIGEPLIVLEALDARSRVASDSDESLAVAQDPTASVLRGLALEQLDRTDEAFMVWRAGLESARAVERHDPYSAAGYALLGSLAGDIDERDVERILAAQSAESLGGAVIDALRREVIGNDRIAIVMRSTYDGVEGRRMARRQLFPLDDPSEENRAIGRRLTLVVGRHLIGGFGSEGAPALSDVETRTLLSAFDEGVRSFEAGEIGQFEATRLLATLKGVTGLFGWSGLARKLSPEVRIAGAYVLGCHLANEGNRAGARALLTDALDQAGAENPLRPFVERRLADLPTD